MKNDVTIPAHDASLDGSLHVPDGACGGLNIKLQTLNAKLQPERRV